VAVVVEQEDKLVQDIENEKVEVVNIVLVGIEDLEVVNIVLIDKELVVVVDIGLNTEIDRFVEVHSKELRMDQVVGFEVVVVGMMALMNTHSKELDENNCSLRRERVVVVEMNRFGVGYTHLVETFQKNDVELL
jgi:hypothetical protein